jgi:hypothetical protein
VNILKWREKKKPVAEAQGAEGVERGWWAWIVLTFGEIFTSLGELFREDDEDDGEA